MDHRLPAALIVAGMGVRERRDHQFCRIVDNDLWSAKFGDHFCDGFRRSGRISKINRMKLTNRIIGFAASQPDRCIPTRIKVFQNCLSKTCASACQYYEWFVGAHAAFRQHLGFPTPSQRDQPPCRQIYLSNRVFGTYSAIFDAGCEARNSLVNAPDTIRSIGSCQCEKSGQT